MPDRAVLLRGVNVGGAGRLAMSELRAALAEAGLDRPQSLIQSGNLVVGSDLAEAALADQIAGVIAARFGFRPEVFVLDAAGLEAALDHPFGDVPAGSVHAVFARPEAACDAAAVAALADPSERWCWQPGLFRLHAPQGVGRSRLMERLPRLLGAPATGRNLRTLAGLAELLRQRAVTAA